MWEAIMQIANQQYPFTATTILDGSVSVGTTAAALTTGSVPCRGVEVTALVANTDYILIGNSGSQNKRLNAGDSVFVSIDNVQKIWGKSNSGTQTATYLGVA